MNIRNPFKIQHLIQLFLVLCLSLVTNNTYAQGKKCGQGAKCEQEPKCMQGNKQVQETNSRWEVVFSNSLCNKKVETWKQLFFLDGLNGKITDTAEGLSFEAGYGNFFHADHSVLWTKETFKDGLKVSYDFRRDDTITKDEVCILYLLAEGIGQSPFKEDIEKWSELRRIPYMYIYFWGMRLAHISYATRSARVNRSDNTNPYIRCRTYPMETNKTVWTKLPVPPSYDDPGFFKPHKWYHIEAIKNGKSLTFHVIGEEMDKTFNWENKRLGKIKSGRIGFRQMQGRNSSYRNLCISQLQNK